jgi:putative FmdB family regulatory protein
VKKGAKSDMPIYEFKCNCCGKEFEQIVFACDKGEPVPCPSCGKEDTGRILSSFSCSPSTGGSAGGSSSCSSHSHKGFS